MRGSDRVNPEETADLPGLHGLTLRENDVFLQHYCAAVADAHMRRVLRLADDSLHFMVNFAGAPQHTEDARTVSAIAGRIFNTTAGALREALNGYPQTSLLLQRDLIETHALLDVFSHDLTRLSRWRVVTNDERIKEFSPGKLRFILKDHYGAEHIALRKADYQRFSEHAAHLTYPSLRMLHLPSGSTQLGPRFDVAILRECVHELGRRVLLAVLGDAKVLLALHRRDGQANPSDVEDLMTKIRNEGISIYSAPAERPSTNGQ
jgi:hypothetical protein